MKKMFSIAILALFGLAFILNGAEASHYRPLSVMVNKPVGEEVIMDEATPETAGKMEANEEENLEKTSEPSAPAMENDGFGGVWESGCCGTPCCEEETICCEDARLCCCVRRPCWLRRCWPRMTMRCCCAPCMGTAMVTNPVTETGCGCGN